MLRNQLIASTISESKMSFKHKITEFEEEKKAFQKKIDEIKPQFKIFITDKSIPLFERWNEYINAPSELKDRLDYLFEPKSRFLKNVRENWFKAPEIYGRGRHIHINKLFNDIIYENNIYLENIYKGTFTRSEVEEAMEELLTMNLEYFTYDW